MESNDWLEDYLNDEETIKLYSKWNEVINRNTGYFFGEKDGSKRSQISIAKEMLKDDIPLDSIIKYTKLKKEELLSLKEQ